MRAEAVCICSRIQKVRNRTGITILQHVRERRHPLGTARIARLALEQCQYLVGWYEPPLEPPPAPAVPERTALLYPSRTSTDITTLAAEDRPEHLIVLDGTWRNVRALYRAHEWLHELPQVHLPVSSPSRYRIRKAPRPGNLSTIEAIARALQILEPETPGIEALLQTFESMIDEQIELMPDEEDPRHGRK